MMQRLVEDYMVHPDAFQLSNIDLRAFENANLRHFIAGGYGSMTSQWLIGGMKESPQEISEEMAGFVKRLTLMGD